MGSQNIRCMKMYLINHDKVELDSEVASICVTQQKGVFAGGTSKKDLMDCPKMGQNTYDICKDCMFSVPVTADVDMLDV